MDSSQGRLQITLLKELSGGTFARVYLAEATGAGGIKRIVAVKVLRAEWSESEEFISRTKDEARMLSQLRHPNIVKVEDMAQLDGQLCLVMELVDGVDVQELLEVLKTRGERLPPRATFEIVAKVASALDAAWNKIPYGRDAPIRVVHRDVKPSNVMVTPDSEVKVLDFGTAMGRFEEREASTKMFRFGSLKYMSPERRDGDRGTHPGDTYSLGLMLMEMLQGSWLGLLPEPPDHESAIHAAVDALTNTGMPAEDWDAAVRKVLRQMCADRADHRPNSEQVARLMRAFAEVASGQGLENWGAENLPRLLASVREEKEAGDLAGSRIYIGGSSEPIPIAQSKLGEPPLPSGAHPLLRMAPPEDTLTGRERAPAAPPINEDATAILPIPVDLPLGLSDDATQILSGIPPLDDPSYPPRPMARPVSPPVAPPPVAPPPPPHAPAWSTAPPPPPMAPPAWAPVPESGNETQVFSAGQPLISRNEETTGAVPKAPEPPAAHPHPIIQGPVAPEPSPSTEPPVEKKKGGCGKLVGVGCLVFVLLVLCLGCAGAVRGMLAGPAEVDVVEPVAVPEPEPVVEGGVSLAVNVVGENLQWCRVLDSAGQTVIKGDEAGLEASLAADRYTLAVKAIGRPVVKAELSLISDTTLACALQKSGEVHCDGLSEPLVLVSN